MSCNNNCESCNAPCSIKCPLCHGFAMEVPSVTVLTLSNAIIDLDELYYMCTKNSCKCAYFNENRVILTEQLNTKIWFKSTYDEYIVCYCRKIYLKDVVAICFKLKGDLTVENLLLQLPKHQQCASINCLINNPTGESCERLLNSAVEYAKHIYKQKGEEEI